MATYKDILAAPENKVAELIDGELVLSPRPSGAHSSVMSVLNGKLMPRFGQGGGRSAGWIILIEPELHLGKQVLVPDLAGWRTSRLPRIPKVPYFTLAPDWVCEVASRSTKSIDRKRKLPIYAKARVEHVWMIEPRDRVLEVLERSDQYWRTVGYHMEAERVRAAPFEELVLDLSTLWAALPSRASERTSELYY